MGISSAWQWTWRCALVWCNMFQLEKHVSVPSAPVSRTLSLTFPWHHLKVPRYLLSILPSIVSFSSFSPLTPSSCPLNVYLILYLDISELLHSLVASPDVYVIYILEEKHSSKTGCFLRGCGGWRMCEFSIGYGAKNKGLGNEKRVKQGGSKREMGKNKWGGNMKVIGRKRTGKHLTLSKSETKSNHLRLREREQRGNRGK